MKINEEINVLGYKSNTVLLIVENKGLLVDSGYDEEDSLKIIELVKESGIVLEKVLISHYHEDHIQGVQLLKSYYPEMEFVCSPITKFFYEYNWLQSILYNCNSCRTRRKVYPQVNFHVILSEFDFYNVRVEIKPLNGHCHGNLLVKIGKTLYCPDVILHTSDSLPFVSDVNEYFNDFAYLKNYDYTGVKQIVLSHGEVICEHTQFVEMIEQSEDILTNIVKQILHIVEKKCEYDAAFQTLVESRLVTKCFGTEFNVEQYGYTRFVFDNIVRYLEESKKIYRCIEHDKITWRIVNHGN